FSDLIWFDANVDFKQQFSVNAFRSDFSGQLRASRGEKNVDYTTIEFLPVVLLMLNPSDAVADLEALKAFQGFGDRHLNYIFIWRGFFQQQNFGVHRRAGENWK